MSIAGIDLEYVADLHFIHEHALPRAHDETGCRAVAEYLGRVVLAALREDRNVAFVALSKDDEYARAAVHDKFLDTLRSAIFHLESNADRADGSSDQGMRDAALRLRALMTERER